MLSLLNVYAQVTRPENTLEGSSGSYSVAFIDYERKMVGVELTMTVDGNIDDTAVQVGFGMMYDPAAPVVFKHEEPWKLYKSTDDTSLDVRGSVDLLENDQAVARLIFEVPDLVEGQDMSQAILPAQEAIYFRLFNEADEQKPFQFETVQVTENLENVPSMPSEEFRSANLVFSQGSESSDSNLAIILGGVAGAIVLFLLLFFLMRHRNKMRDEKPDTTEAPVTQQVRPMTDYSVLDDDINHGTIYTDVSADRTEYTRFSGTGTEYTAYTKPNDTMYTEDSNSGPETMYTDFTQNEEGTMYTESSRNIPETMYSEFSKADRPVTGLSDWSELEKNDIRDTTFTDSTGKKDHTVYTTDYTDYSQSNNGTFYTEEATTTMYSDLSSLRDSEYSSRYNTQYTEDIRDSHLSE